MSLGVPCSTPWAVGGTLWSPLLALVARCGAVPYFHTYCQLSLQPGLAWRGVAQSVAPGTQHSHEPGAA